MTRGLFKRINWWLYSFFHITFVPGQNFITMSPVPDIYSIYQMMERDHIILSFKGQITKDLMASVYQIMESRLESINEDPKKKKKVYNILVETLQNIYHHMDELQKDEEPDDTCRDAMFMIVRGEDGIYKIHTGNFILNSKCDILNQRIEQINAMSPEELRAHYVDTLNTTGFSDKGGAGLGIIDIARKSGNKLGYGFNHVSDKYSFFSLVVSID